MEDVAIFGPNCWTLGYSSDFVFVVNEERDPPRGQFRIQLYLGSD